MMFDHWLIPGAVAVVCNLASCAGQPQQVAREQQDYDAECGKFGAAIGTPTYIDCRVALRALEQLEQAAHSPLHASFDTGPVASTSIVTAVNRTSGKPTAKDGRKRAAAPGSGLAS